MIRALPALLVGALAGLPQAASACAQLTENVWMCAGETEWAQAEWDAEGDGSTLFLGEVVLNFTEEFPGHEIRESDTTLQEQFATYETWVAAEGGSPEKVFLADQIDLMSGSALRQIQRDMIDGDPKTSAVMLARVSNARIMLYLDAPAHIEVARMEVMSRELLGLLDDHCSDVSTCTRDDARLDYSNTGRG